jgi:hypothetical protein
MGWTDWIDGSASERNGITIGGYININIMERYSKEKYEPDGEFTPTGDPLFMHEYGHYLQSQDLGLSYLFDIGIPSMISAFDPETISGDDISNPYGLNTHDVSKHERDANRRAAVYFSTKGVDWTNHTDFGKYPIEYPTFIKDDYSYIYISYFREFFGGYSHQYTLTNRRSGQRR